jgi:hypothetical protein
LAEGVKVLFKNSGEKAVGIELYLDQITKAEPFASLFSIKPEVFEAIKADMAVNGFDPSKPVNVWRKADGTRRRWCKPSRPTWGGRSWVHKTTHTKHSTKQEAAHYDHLHAFPSV